MTRLDRVDPAAEPHDVGDELGHALGIDPAYDELVALVVELSEARKARLCCAIEVGHAYPHGVTAEELVEGALRDDPAAIDDGDAVADLLHLAQEVRVEEDGRAALAQPADDLAHVVPADRIERARGLVEHDEVGRAEDLTVTRRRRRESEQQLHRRRLAGAIRSEESEDVAARNGHRQTGERGDAAVSLGQLLRAYRRRVDQCSEFATASTCCSVSVPATPYTMPSFCQITALPSPVESPTKLPSTACTVTFFEVAMSTGIGTGSVLEGSLIARICAASCGEMPGCARR